MFAPLLVAAASASFAGAALAQDGAAMDWRAGPLRPQVAPAYLGADAWPGASVFAGTPDAVRFSEIPGSVRMDREAVMLAAAAERTAALQNDVVAATGDRFDSRVGAAFARIAAVEDARAAGAPPSALASANPRAWTPTASSSLVAFNLQRD